MQPDQTRTVLLPGGGEVQMTHEQIQQHLLAQAQAHAQSQTMVYPPHLLHPQGISAHHPGTMFNMTNRQALSAPIAQHAFGLGIDLGGSPSTDGASNGKRGLEPSPIDAVAKRAKMEGRKPSRSFALSKIVALTGLPAPEDHQRQAREAASRAAAIGTPPPSIRSQSGRPNEESLPDPHRRYSKAQAHYAQQQLGRSPAALLAMSPGQTTESSPLINYSMQSPATPFEMSLGMNGIPQMPDPPSAHRLQHEQLRVDVAPDGLVMGADLPPPSAASSTKRKPTARKPGPKPGTKPAPRKKPTKLKQPASASEEASAEQSPTPTQLPHLAHGLEESPVSSSYQITPTVKTAVSGSQMSAFPALDSSEFEHAQQRHQLGQVRLAHDAAQTLSTPRYEPLHARPHSNGESSAVLQVHSSSDGPSSSEVPNAADFLDAFESFADGDAHGGYGGGIESGFEFDVRLSRILDAGMTVDC